MAHYQLIPNEPRPLSAVHVGVAPGRDARWRGVPKATHTVDRTEVLEAQRRLRNKGRRL